MDKKSTVDPFLDYESRYILLKIIDGPEIGTEFKININKVFQLTLLGRDDVGSEAFLKIKNIDKCISRNHCIFEVFENKIYLIDNNSLNGTWLYRKGYSTFKNIKIKVKLEDNDIILLGNTKLIIRMIINTIT
jgi:pSer/pThr/pTyr-binding forkhead associated (FHA) protein